MSGMTTFAAAPAAMMAGIDPFVLVVLLFIALPLIQGVFGKKQREDQRRRMDQRRTQQGRPDASTGSATQERRAETAADLVPDDLWELLTGERRQRTLDPVPSGDWEGSGQDVPASGPSLPGEPQPDWQAIPEPAPYEPLTEAQVESSRPWRTSDQPTPMVLRRERSDDLPEAVSLEQPIVYDDAQERAFHEELANLPPPARARHRRPLPFGLGHDEEVRRAFILTEILGPPKGLR